MTYRELFFGFDSFFDAINNPQQQQSYPPYNVIKKDDNHYLIEIAVAGFKSKEIDMILEKGTLTVSGKRKEYDNNKNDEYIHKGISARNFSHNFTLSETIKVVGADIVDGLLMIGLENEIPEVDKPRTINLGSLSTKAKELLMS